MRYPIVATDFDDTLLKSDLSLSKYTTDVIKAYEKAGGTLIVSTGRMYSSIYNSAMRVGLKKGLVISYQGALINDSNDHSIIHHNVLSVKDAVNLAKALEKENAVLQAYINDELCVKEMTKETRNYETVCEIKAKVIGSPISEYIEKNNFTPTKLLLVIDPQRAKELYIEFPKAYGNSFDFCISKPYFFEVLAKGSNKGAAVKYLCEKRGFTNSDVITFGDAINDLTMLEYADLSFAVANGSDEAKKVAKQICPSNDEDGVAKIIEQYCL